MSDDEDIASGTVDDIYPLGDNTTFAREADPGFILLSISFLLVHLTRRFLSCRPFSREQVSSKFFTLYRQLLSSTDGILGMVGGFGNFLQVLLLLMKMKMSTTEMTSMRLAPIILMTKMKPKMSLTM